MQNFDDVLDRAKAGDVNAVSELLQEFEPLIIHYSTVNGMVNEDLRHQIILNFIEGIRNFQKI